MKSEDNSNEDNSYEMHSKKEKRTLISPFTPAGNPTAKINSFTEWNEKLKKPFSEHDKLIKYRNTSTLTAGQVVHKPKYLPLPPFLQPKKEKSFPYFSNFMKEMDFFTSKHPIEGRILSIYDQPWNKESHSKPNQQAKNSFLTPPNQSALNTPAEQDFSKDLSLASSVSRVINGSNYLQLSPFLQPKNAKPFQDFSTSMAEMKHFTPKLPPKNKILPRYEQPVKSVFISFLTHPKQPVLVPVQNIMSKQDVPRDVSETTSLRQIIHEPKYLTLPPFYKFTKSRTFQKSSASVKMNFFTSILPHRRTTLLEYKQPATNTFIPGSTPPSHFELTAPAQNYMSVQENVFENKSKTAKSFPNILSERTTLLEYKQPATNSLISSSTPWNRFEIAIPAQNVMHEQENLFQDKSRPAKPFPNILSERTTLFEYQQPTTNNFIPFSTPLSPFELRRPAENNVPGQETLSEVESKVEKIYTDILSNRTTFHEYKQTATSIFIPNSISPNLSELIAPAQNSAPKQENVFEDESKTVKPTLATFPDVNENIMSPFEAYKNSTLQHHSETVQEQNRLTHKSISKTMPFNLYAKMYSQNAKNIPLNVKNSKMYNRSGKKFKTYNRTPTSPSSIGINSTEMSSLQYFHHKLKQAKSIHDSKYYLKFTF